MQGKHPWAMALALWAVLSLSFMLGMGVGSAVFFLVSLWYLRKDRSLAKELATSGLAWATLLFWMAALLSVLVASIDPPLGLPVQGPVEFKKAHFFLLPFFAAAALLRSSEGGRLEKHLLWRPYFWMAFFVCVLGIVQFWAGHLFPASWLEHRFFRPMVSGTIMPVFHAQGLMFFHLSFASAIGFVCTAAWARLLWPLVDDRKKEKMAWLALALTSTLAFFYTFSRIAWVAIVLMIFLLALLRNWRWGLGALLGLGLLMSATWFGSESLRGRWSNGTVSLFERQHVWAGALAMVKDRPWTGVGFGKTGYYSDPYIRRALGERPRFSSHAHNNILDIWAAMGVAGLVAFLAWWAVLLFYAWRAFRVAQEKWLPASCLVACLLFHVNGLTQVNFFDSKSQHSLMLWAGIMLALGIRHRARVL